MRKFIKPMILALLAVILVVVISIPQNLTAIQFYPGLLYCSQGTYFCICPMIGNCQCGFLEPTD